MLGERVAAGEFPSAVYLVGERGCEAFGDALGEAVRVPERCAATLETVYDLASLTKPLVTGLLCARLVELGELTLDSSVSHYLGEFDRTDKQVITVRELLAHTSGLPAWRPLYIAVGGEKEAALAAIANEPLEGRPGARVIYSDLGFMALGLLLERLTGRQLDDLARRQIFEPLGLQRTLFNPPASMRQEIAASENGNGYERSMVEREFPEFAGYGGWRNGVIWGQVHDGNAHFLGGVAGHAGLFSTARETFKLANQFIAGQTRLLRAETCSLFRQNLTTGLNEARSLAWQLAATPDSSAGASLPRDSFGHNGFTGVSCWVDPHQQRVFILLTNRTHARALPFPSINDARREFHRLAVSALESHRQ